MENPISNETYHTSIAGIKRWAAHELPYGIPLLYSLVGFVVIVALLYSLLSATTWALNWTIPNWAYLGLILLGVFWAFGGWQHGRQAEEDLDISDTEEFKLNP